MEILLVPSALGDLAALPAQHLTSYLINGSLAVDAGCIGFYGSAAQQASVRHVLLSHAHLDHVASLPILAENAYQAGRPGLTVHASSATLEVLRRDLFNDRIWPDYERIGPPDAPILRFSTLESGRPIELEGLRVTPIAVDHVIPTLGFLVEGPGAAVLFSSDTAPTAAIWRVANATPDLKAVFLEATFPDALADLARVAQHLHPAIFRREVAKLDRPVPIVAVHLKSRFRDEVVGELMALGLPDLRIGEPGVLYRF